MSKLILETLNQTKKQKEIPVWLMRQAGRYLPEYKIIRKEKKNFLELCYNPKLAAEITLQPIRRFKLDAAIIFSDILVIPDSMGVKVNFEENQGPVLEQITNLADLKEAFKRRDTSKITNVYEAIRTTKEQLPKDVALIGFSGAPWTLAAYIVEGKISRDLSRIKSIYYNNKEFIITLINELVENIIIHILNQIKAGAEVIQIFDSWAGTLAGEDYEQLVIRPTQKIIEQVKKVQPNIPIICFPRMSGINYKKFCELVDCEVISIDQFTPLSWIRENNYNKVIQGNLDPICLLSKSKELLKRKIDIILEEMKNQNFIFNLGHGVVPETPIENVKFLVDYIKEKREY